MSHTKHRTTAILATAVLAALPAAATATPFDAGSPPPQTTAAGSSAHLTDTHSPFTGDSARVFQTRPPVSAPKDASESTSLVPFIAGGALAVGLIGLGGAVATGRKRKSATPAISG